MSGNGMEHLRTPEEVAAFDLSQQQADIHELQQQITELQAHVEVLREAFTEMDKQLISMGSKGTVLKTSVYQDALRAFDQTPKQSYKHLQADGIEEMINSMSSLDAGYGAMYGRKSIEFYVKMLREQAKE